MDWILLALFAAAFSGMSAVVDKFILEKVVKDPFSYSLVMEFLWWFFVIAVLIVKPITFSFPFTALATLTGIIGMSSYFFYTKAMHVEEASRAIPLTHFATIFTTLIAFVFLNEVFTPIRYLGILMVVAGAISLSYRRAKECSSGRREKYPSLLHCF